MTPWSRFSACSQNCAGGMKKRTRKVYAHSKNGGKACELGVEFSGCNAAPCPNTDLKDQVKEVSQKFQSTQRQLNETKLFLAAEKNETIAAEEVHSNATTEYNQLRDEQKQLEATVQSSNSKSEKVKVKLEKALKRKHPNMHKILDLAATAKALHGEAKRKVVLEIKDLAKSAAESESANSEEIDKLKQDDDKARIEAREAAASLKVKQSAMASMKTKLLSAEKDVKASEWNTGNLRHTASYLSQLLTKVEARKSRLTAQVEQPPVATESAASADTKANKTTSAKVPDQNSEEKVNTPIEEKVHEKAQEKMPEKAQEDKKPDTALSPKEVKSNTEKPPTEMKVETTSAKAPEPSPPIAEETKAELVNQTQGKESNETEDGDREIEKQEEEPVSEDTQKEKEESPEPPLSAESIEKRKQKALEAEKLAAAKVTVMKHMVLEYEEAEDMESQRLEGVKKALKTEEVKNDEAQRTKQLFEKEAQAQDQHAEEKITDLRRALPGLAQNSSVINVTNISAVNSSNITALVKAAENSTNVTGSKVHRIEAAALAAVDDSKTAHKRAQSLSAESNATSAVVQQLINEEKEQNAEISLNVAKESEKLSKVMVKCADGSCKDEKGTQEAITGKIQKMQAEMKLKATQILATYKMLCGDGKFQNENGEQCDDGNQNPGDGCDQHCRIEAGWSCAGGSWSHESVCDLCGNGVVRATEECDDGNTADGDGCSSTCRIEEEFACSQITSAGQSQSLSECVSLQQKQKQTLSLLGGAYSDCYEKGMFFIPSQNVSDDKQCLPNTEIEGRFASGDESGVASAAADTLSTSGSEIMGDAVLKLTCPLPIDSSPGLAPYAACVENRYEACETTAGASRICHWRKLITCEEVCVAPRFCEKATEPRGYLVKRAYGPSRTPTDKACCYKRCIVPPSWKSKGQSIHPTSWCLPFAQATWHS